MNGHWPFSTGERDSSNAVRSPRTEMLADFVEAMTAAGVAGLDRLPSELHGDDG
jgi:hypothetical protein